MEGDEEDGGAAAAFDGGAGGSAAVGLLLLVETSLLDLFQVTGGSVSSGGDSAAGRLEKESVAVGGRRC